MASLYERLITRDAKLYANQKVGVFLDFQNIAYGVKYLGDVRLDFAKLLNLCIRGRILVRAISYMVNLDGIDLSKFIVLLKGLGYEVRYKHPKKWQHDSEVKIKADWDVGLVIDVISMLDSIDVVVLLSGDGDFVDLVNYVKAKGKKVEVISVGDITSRELINVANEYIDLKTMIDDLKLEG